MKTLLELLYSHAEAFKALSLNVLGGVLAALSLDAYRSIKDKLRRQSFRRVFGGNSLMHLVYGDFLIRLDQNAPPRAFALAKESNPHLAFSAERVASGCEIRAASYLSYALTTMGQVLPAFVSDDEIAPRLDIDFISFGALSNRKTMDAFENPGNHLVRYDQAKGFFVWKEDGDRVCDHDPGKDYGVILKLHPEQFPKRTWIACAGIGEWGTSGAAWFLANKWLELDGRINTNREFVAIVRVESRQDESASLVAAYDRGPRRGGSGSTKSPSRTIGGPSGSTATVVQSK